MKQKYKRFTDKYCQQLAEMYLFMPTVKEYIQSISDEIHYRKKWDFSKNLYHIKYDLFLGASMDVRKARNILSNPKKFEQFFNQQCEYLKANINHRLVNFEFKKDDKYNQVKQACEEVIKRFIQENHINA